LPDRRPSEKIARLFPQVDPVKDQAKDAKSGAKPTGASAGAASKDAAVQNAPATLQANAERVPLPEARPVIEPIPQGHRHRRAHRYLR
jgi:peptidoglycan lytic transglycosylase A